MLKTKSMVLLAATCAVLVIAIFTTREESADLPRAGEPLFPDLTTRLNDVVKLQVHSRESFDLLLDSGQWVIPQLDGYVAASENVRAWMLGLADLKIREPKTRSPELYDKLGLGEPGRKGSTSTRYTLLNAGQETVADVTIGTQTASDFDSERSELYVLDADEPQVWMVEGRIPEYRTVLDFVSNKLLEVARSRIARVTLRHGDGEFVEVARSDSETQSFSIVNTDRPVKADTQWQVDDIGYGLAHLTLKGVSLRDEVAFEETFRVDLSTFDGLQITLQGSRQDARATLARLSATTDPEKVSDEARERIDTEVAQLNQRWDKWIFTMSTYEAGKFDYKVSDLVESGEVETAE